MLKVLEHLQANSRRIEADRVAHNHQIKQAAERIDDAAHALANVERDAKGDNKIVAPFREALRKAKQDRARIKFPAIIDPLPEVEKWIARRPKASPVDLEQADIRPGETPLMAHNRVQVSTAAILTRVRGLETAPQQAAQQTAALVSQIAALAKAPQFVNGVLMLPKVSIANGVGNAITMPDAVGLMAWAFKDAFGKAMQRLVTEDATAISPEHRAAQLSEAYIELVASLRQEVATATAAEKAGQRVVRRRGIHPAIILGLTVNPAEAYRYIMKGV